MYFVQFMFVRRVIGPPCWSKIVTVQIHSDPPNGQDFVRVGFYVRFSLEPWESKAGNSTRYNIPSLGSLSLSVICHDRLHHEGDVCAFVDSDGSMWRFGQKIPNIRRRGLTYVTTFTLLVIVIFHNNNNNNKIIIIIITFPFRLQLLSSFQRAMRSSERIVVLLPWRSFVRLSVCPRRACIVIIRCILARL